MSFDIFNLHDGTNNNINVTDQIDNFYIIEYKHELNLQTGNAMQMYYSAKMGFCKRQVVMDFDYSDGGFILNNGEMLYHVGDIEVTTGVSMNPVDIMKKAVKSKLSDESFVKPLYKGSGVIVTESTYNHIILLDVSSFDNGVILSDGKFICCNESVDLDVSMIKSLSGLALGGEGIFNLKAKGKGVIAITSPCHRDDIVVVEIDNETLTIDGDLALYWDGSVKMTVGKSSKTLIGSAMTGEGLVNIFTGKGRIFMKSTR